jgi:hypothetical protein
MMMEESVRLSCGHLFEHQSVILHTADRTRYRWHREILGACPFPLCGHCVDDSRAPPELRCGGDRMQSLANRKQAKRDQLLAWVNGLSQTEDEPPLKLRRLSESNSGSPSSDSGLFVGADTETEDEPPLKQRRLSGSGRSRSKSGANVGAEACLPEGADMMEWLRPLPKVVSPEIAIRLVDYVHSEAAEFVAVIDDPGDTVRERLAEWAEGRGVDLARLESYCWLTYGEVRIGPRQTFAELGIQHGSVLEIWWVQQG